MWLHFVRQMWPQNCVALRDMSHMWPRNCVALRDMSQIPTVSSVQVANVVNMSDRQSGGGCRREHTSSAVDKLLRSQEECMGDGLCSILTRSWPRRRVGSRVVLLACSLDGRRIVVLFPAGTSIVSLLRTSRPTRGHRPSQVVIPEGRAGGPCGWPLICVQCRGLTH